MKHVRRGAGLLAIALAFGACGSSAPTVMTAADDLGVSIDDDMVYDPADSVEDAAGDAAAQAEVVAEFSAPRELDVVLSPEDESLWAANSAANMIWTAAGIDGYDYRLESLTPDGHALLQVEVRNGEVTNRIATEASSNKNAFPMSSLFDGVYELILDEGDESNLLKVEYDPELGFPTRIEFEAREGDEVFTGWLSATEFRSADDYPEECSSFGVQVADSQADMPQSVAHTRELLLGAARDCSFLTLASVASEGDGQVETSFGGSGVELIWQLETEGDPVLTAMAALLNGPAAETGDGFVWPAVFADPTSDYLGWRVGIDHDGDWAFLIAGD
ncbi:MAG: DUF6174 domain-containing protein [Acidimicrobiia bacterium]|nr:DUF6174 domain-containing protein [Acidimicrobiia bacterium]